MTASVMNVKFKDKTDNNASYIAIICAPRTPMISGMSATVSAVVNNKCKILIENSAPYDVTIKRDDILSIMDIKNDELLLFSNDVIASTLNDINDHFPRTPRKMMSMLNFYINVVCKSSQNTKEKMSKFYSNVRKPLGSMTVT